MTTSYVHGPGQNGSPRHKPWVILDIDDTCAAFGPYVYQRFNLALGSNHKLEDLTDYDMHKHMGITLERFYDLLAVHHIFETLPVYEEWRGYAVSARAAGYNVGYITARGMAAHAKAKTLVWLHQNGFPVDGLWIVEPGSEKCLVVPDGTVVAVEDSDKHAERYHAYGINRVYLIERPWNRHHDLHRKVSCGTSAECAADAMRQLVPL